MTLIPGYGRDYKSKSAVMADWNANKDFIISDHFDPSDGKLINKPQVKPGTRVNIRYHEQRKVLTFVA